MPQFIQDPSLYGWPGGFGPPGGMPPPPAPTPAPTPSPAPSPSITDVMGPAPPPPTDGGDKLQDLTDPSRSSAGPSGGGSRPPSTPPSPAGAGGLDTEITPEPGPALPAPGSGFLPSSVAPNTIESLAYRSPQFGFNRFKGRGPERFGAGSPLISAGDLADDPTRRSLDEALDKLMRGR